MILKRKSKKKEKMILKEGIYLARSKMKEEKATERGRIKLIVT